MKRRRALPILVGIFAVAASGVFAGTIVSGSIGASAPCQAWQGNRLQSTIAIVKDWPDEGLFDRVRRCENDAVDFTAPWDPAKASSWLTQARDRGFVDRPVDSVRCGRDLDLVCQEHGATASRRFDPDGHGFDRCTGVCTDGTAVRSIRLELNRTPSQ